MLSLLINGVELSLKSPVVLNLEFRLCCIFVKFPVMHSV